MDEPLRTQLVRVHGDEQAKEINHCPACRELRIQEREAKRVKDQRDRRRRGDVRHRTPGKRTRAQDRPPHTAVTRVPAVPDTWANFLPTTIAVLAQIREQAGGYLATEMASALQAELNRLCTTIGRERQEALIQLFDLGDQLSCANLIDVEVDAGLERWSTFANSASLDQLRAAVQNAQRLAGAAERRRKLARRGSPDQPESLQEEKKALRVELYLHVQGNSNYIG